MATNPIISSSVWGGFTAKSYGSSSASFLNYATESPVQKMLKAQKAEKEKLGGYEDSEDFLRMKAFEISNRIKLMNRMGQTAAVAQLQVEGQEVVKKYMELQQKAAAKALEDQVNEQFGL